MKTCSECKQEKPESEFHKNSSYKCGLSPCCKQCKKGMARVYYLHDKDGILQRTKKKKDEYRLRLWKLKSAPCVDCGGTFHPYVMDFDHRDSDQKLENVSRLARGNWEAVVAEAAKCDLVCANCHRMRTLKRMSGTPDWPVEVQSG